ncbi:MAG: FmdB family transcriptional regulator [Ilumatobacteraceae bacterium]|nr:FmdB family transcriptional regulator [Ilumatobacteraceae bacterium]
MPTYVYKFIDTGETIEVQQAFTDDALTEAEHPGSGKKLKVKKVFTPVGVTFKGGGFYKTDSRGGKSKASSTTTPSSESSSASSSSSDSASSNGASKSSDSSTTSTTPVAKPSTPAKTSSGSD